MWVISGKVLEQHKAAVTCEELAIAVREYWGRSFPQNPYEDPCLIYKLTGTYLDVEYECMTRSGRFP